MSGKRPTDHLEPSAKKRGNDRQITKDDDLSGEEEEQVDAGDFARASDAVLKQRKIVRARRGAGGGEEGTTANPFAGIQLAPAAPAGVSLFGAQPPAAQPDVATAAEPTPPPAGEQQQQEKPAEAAGVAAAPAQEQPAPAEEPKPADAAPAGTTNGSAAPASGGFGGLAAGGLSFGAGGGFGGVTGGGFGSLSGASAGAFSFGGPAAASTGASSIFSFGASAPAAAAAAPLFSFGAAPAAGTSAAAAAPPAAPGASLFGTTPATGTSVFGSAPAPAAKVELPAEQAVTTGEEDERTVYSGDGVLFEFDASKQWRERGRGEARINVAPSGQARVVMRQKGNLRLLLNANLWPEMHVTKMEGGKGATFACVNAAAGAGEEGAAKKDEVGDAAAAAAAGAAEGSAPRLATFALRIKGPELLEQFLAAVNTHKAGGGSAKKEGAGA